MLSMMVNRVKTRKILSKRCLGYLAHIISKVDELIANLQTTLIVCEFQHVFLVNLLKLAPKKKVKFKH